MSQVGLPVRGFLDPTLAIEQKEQFGVIFGAQAINWTPNVSTSYTINQVSHVVTPPDVSQVIEPKIYMRWQVQLSFTGTSSSGNLLQLGTCDGLRAFPISAAIGIQNMNFQINAGNQAQGSMDSVPALASYGLSKDELNLDLSMTPTMPDQYQNYGDWTLYGSGRNPLALHGESASYQTRGGFPVTVVSNTPTSAVVQFTVTEPFFLSPAVQTGSKKGWTGVTSITYTIPIADMRRMWSHDAINGNSISAITASFIAPPELRLKYLNPYTPIQRGLYDFQQLFPFQVTGTSLAPNATTTLTSSLITTTVIPTKIYVYARITNSQQTFSTSDTFAAITNFQIQWGGVTYMNNANQQDLYALCVRNFCKMSWPQWSQYRGSVLCIIPGVDFPLQPGEAPSLSKQVNFQVQATIQNVNPSQTFQYDLQIISVCSGVWELTPGGSSMTTATITPEDVAKTAVQPKMPLDLHYRLQGGSFWDTIKSGLSKAADFVSNYGPKIVSAVGAVRPIFGLGLRGRGLDMSAQREPKRARLSGAGFIDESGDAQMDPQDEKEMADELPARGGGGSSSAAGGRLPVRSQTGGLPLRR